jgi:hypothetical protein
VAGGFSVVNHNLFKGFEIKRGGTIISHLQYMDDTLCIGEATRDKLWALKTLLRSFQMATGLKVSLFKSFLIGVNISPSFM